MNEKDRALERFIGGLNCAQSVFVTFAAKYNLAEEISLRITSPLGGGLAHRQEVCGAISGALLVLGLHFGQSDPANRAPRELCNRRASEFLVEFERRHGSLYCRRLLNFDITTPQGLAAARRKGLFSTVCLDYVRDAIEILQGMLVPVKKGERTNTEQEFSQDGKDG